MNCLDDCRVMDYSVLGRFIIPLNKRGLPLDLKYKFIFFSALFNSPNVYYQLLYASPMHEAGDVKIHINSNLKELSLVGKTEKCIS